jgi:hypothetical protein
MAVSTHRALMKFCAKCDTFDTLTLAAADFKADKSYMSRVYRGLQPMSKRALKWAGYRKLPQQYARLEEK